MISASIVIHLTPASQILQASECLLLSPLITKLWIIDNSPDDSLRATIEAIKDDRVEYLHVENRGFGAGHNTAIRRINTLPEQPLYHIVMNADVRWTGDVPGLLADYMNTHSDTGIVMPKVWYPDGTLQYSCRRLPTPADLIFKRFLPSSLVKKRLRKYLLADASHEQEFNCPYLLGSFLFFRTEALLEENGFDERFFMYPEDIDITRRIHRRWKTMYWPGTEIIHDHAAASRKNPRMLRIHIINMISYFNKWGWLFDSERRRFNRKLEKELVARPTSEAEGRG